MHTGNQPLVTYHGLSDDAPGGCWCRVDGRSIYSPYLISGSSGTRSAWTSTTSNGSRSPRLQLGDLRQQRLPRRGQHHHPFALRDPRRRSTLPRGRQRHQRCRCPHRPPVQRRGHAPLVSRTYDHGFGNYDKGAQNINDWRYTQPPPSTPNGAPTARTVSISRPAGPTPTKAPARIRTPPTPNGRCASTPASACCAGATPRPPARSDRHLLPPGRKRPRPLQPRRAGTRHPRRHNPDDLRAGALRLRLQGHPRRPGTPAHHHPGPVAAGVIGAGWRTDLIAAPSRFNTNEPVRSTCDPRLRHLEWRASERWLFNVGDDRGQLPHPGGTGTAGVSQLSYDGQPDLAYLGQLLPSQPGWRSSRGPA